MKVIVYHRIEKSSINSNYPNLIYFSLDNFRKQLDYLSKNYNLLNKKDFLNKINNKDKFSDKDIILTFDDGTIDHYKYVFPELKKRCICGIFYVPTYNLLYNKMLGVHSLHLLIGKYDSNTILKEIVQYIKKNNIVKKNNKDRYDYIYNNLNFKKDNSTLLKRLINSTRFININDKHTLMEHLLKKYLPNIDINSYYIQKEQIKEMNNNGMIIGNHSITHHYMSDLTYKEQKYEIEKSYEILETIIGKNNIRTFAYPYGLLESFTDETLDILNNTNTSFSFIYPGSIEEQNNKDITEGGFNDIRKRQLLPRYDYSDFKNQQEETYDFFNDNVNIWNNLSENEYSTSFYRNYYVLKLISKKKSGYFLDIGCGTGQLCIKSNLLGWNSYGVDKSENMIKYCIENNKKYKSNANFRNIDILKNTFNNDLLFDIISAQGLIEYISYNELIVFLKNCKKMSKQSGFILIGNRNRLFNLLSNNNYTQNEIKLGMIENMYLENSIILNSKNEKDMIIKLSNLNLNYKNNENNEVQNFINVKTRYQYTPYQIIKLVKKLNFKINSIYPINYHGFLNNISPTIDKLKEKIAKIISTNDIKNRYKLLPWCTTFIINVSKIN